MKSAFIQLKIGLALSATYYVWLVEEVIGRSQCAWWAFPFVLCVHRWRRREYIEWWSRYKYVEYRMRVRLSEGGVHAGMVEYEIPCYVGTARLLCPVYGHPGLGAVWQGGFHQLPVQLGPR